MSAEIRLTIRNGSLEETMAVLRGYQDISADGKETFLLITEDAESQNVFMLYKVEVDGDRAEWRGGFRSSKVDRYQVTLSHFRVAQKGYAAIERMSIEEMVALTEGRIFTYPQTLIFRS